MDTNLISNLFFSGSTGTRVMIYTGYPYSKTEVVDVVSGESFADWADIPFKMHHGAVGANLQGTPVVCGGTVLPCCKMYADYQYLQACYKLTIEGWQQFASLKEIRRKPAGVVHKNKFHIFGGRNTSMHITKLSNTTELISIDGGVEYGPELPEAACLACNHLH